MNYDLEMQKILDDIDLNNKPNLFLHVCCAPCSSYVLERLYNYFNIFIVFYNPNIDTKEEVEKRYSELKRLIKIFDYDIKDSFFTELISRKAKKRASYDSILNSFETDIKLGINARLAIRDLVEEKKEENA